MWEAFQIVWCSTVTSVFLFLCTVLTLQTLYNLTEIRCEKSSLYTTVSIKKCLISFWVWFLALLSLLEYVWLRFACCGKGKKKDLKKQKNQTHIVTINRPRIIPFCISCTLLPFRNVRPARPTMQLNNHWVTSLEEICQISCSFLRSHDSILSKWFCCTSVICKQEKKEPEAHPKMKYKFYNKKL